MHIMRKYKAKIEHRHSLHRIALLYIHVLRQSTVLDSSIRIRNHTYILRMLFLVFLSISYFSFECITAIKIPFSYFKTHEEVALHESSPQPAQRNPEPLIC